MQKKFNNFTIIYDAIDNEFIDDYAKAIENTCLKLSSLFQINIVNKNYKFYICKDVDEFMKLTNKTEKNYRSWMVGSSNNVDMICVLSPRVCTNKSTDYLKKIVEKIKSMKK